MTLALKKQKQQNPAMPHEYSTSYVRDAEKMFRYYKHLAERAIAQVPDDALARCLDAESNSIALIVKHVAGNMRSRWIDFLTSDGEKPNRQRDTEFEGPPKSRVELLAMWEEGWKCVFDALAPLGEADLGRTVLIRNEPHSVMQAIQRQIAHYSYHIGQIVFVAKHCAGEHWTSLSVPRGKSADFTARVRERAARKP
ncbi:MAG: DUF1572 domain-containing protein [Candidatus Acidiferrales bacterium]